MTHDENGRTPMQHVRKLTCGLVLLALSIWTGLGEQVSAVAGEAEKEGLMWRYEVDRALPVAINIGLKPAEVGAPIRIVIGDEPSATAVARITIVRDKDGRALTISPAVYQERVWTDQPQVSLVFWPGDNDKEGLAAVKEDGLDARTWRGHELPLRIEMHRGQVLVWLCGKLVVQTPLSDDIPSVLSIHGASGDAVSSVRSTALASGWQYLPVDLSSIANQAPPQFLARPDEQQEVPFELPGNGSKWVDLTPVKWADQSRDPSSYYARYDQGPYFIGDPRMPMLQIPRGDYVAAHVLAVAEPNESLSNKLSLRMGRYGFREQVLQYDFGTEIPRRRLDDPVGVRLVAVRIPLTAAFAQDILGEIIDVELTKAIRLARRSPDPNRFQWRPLGPTSGVRIAAMTFERSPLQMRVVSTVGGHLFVEPQVPRFEVRLTNISDHVQPYRLKFRATHFHGRTIAQQVSGEIAPGRTAVVPVTLEDAQRGYHDLSITLHDERDGLLLERRTSFALLRDMQRPHRATCPVGTWDFTGVHVTPSDPDFVGPLYQKLGLRYGMFGHTPQDRARFGVIKGTEFKINSRQEVEGLIERYKEAREKDPDLLPHFLIFHEDSVSGPHVARTPDLFHDRPSYRFDATEQKRFDAMYDLATKAAQTMRAFDPTVKIGIGNGPLPLREEFYRRGFPRELFDAAGNEAGVFGRLPETQPPDPIANNASLWMDRQMLDHYGYAEKPVSQCYETIYPSTNPGNLSTPTQAAYLVRHILHSMAWQIPQIRVGCITDVGNSYYFSNWGASGIFHKMPEVNPKPAAVAIATLTWVLDGATFDRSIPTGSESVYALAFHRPAGGRVVALWTVRGQRPLTLQLKEAANATLVDSQGIETEVVIDDGRATVIIGPTPCYLVIDGDTAAIQSGVPVHETHPDAPSKVIDPLDNLDAWKVADQRNPELELYNSMTPRRKGDFDFRVVPQFEGRNNVVQVTPRPIKHGKDTMPMYAELVHEPGIELPGEPTEIGLWVNGNSGWGRIIYELQDAKGERWISIGASAKAANAWMADWLPQEMLDQYDPDQIADWNTDDVFGVSSINFDGWRYMAFPLPGQYPGEGHYWPANSQWRFDQEGRVDYPLTLRKLIVTIPEKVLHVKTFAPVDRLEIYLSELTVTQAEPDSR